REQLKQTDAEYREAKEQFMAAQRELDTQNAEIARIHSDGETVRQRRERDHALIAASSSTKEVQALQSELETLDRRQRELEDRELELMESGEAAQARFDSAIAALTAIDQRRAEYEAAIADAERAINEEA